MTENQDPFLDEFFPAPPTHNRPTTLKSDFKPWHKPRKQWVRKFQWIQEVEKLSQQLRFENGRPLKYLSLPGKDLLDVRCIHGWCQANKVNLRFLGFNDPSDPADPNDSELNLSVAELAQREFIDCESLVVPDKFERIGDTSSIAYTRMIEAGPFDIINLDLCNSIAGHVPLEKQDDYYNAIFRIIEFQKSKKAQPWLLFITTRANEKAVNPSAGRKLFQCIEDNAKLSDEFRGRLATELGIDFSLSNPGVTSRNLVGLGLGKWLLKLLIDGQPKWSLKMLDSAEYKVYPPSAAPDMLSLAFECSLIVQPPNDSVGLARHPNTLIAEVAEEKDFALGLIDSVKNIMDLDVMMHGDEQLRKTMIDEAAHLMTDARYDGAKYKAWAMNW
ncbi:MAG: hypothetical protein FD174_1317 [Geobacteraceae bacterium]|nr:MAG: hypothetical protein FD174_1317 [Geobacteraceae bacterium]